MQEAGWASGTVWGLRKIAPLLGFDPRTVQPVAGRYTGYAIPVKFRFLYRSHLPDLVQFVKDSAPATPTGICSVIMSFITKQAMYVLRNIEVRSWNSCCRGKAISTSYIFWVCFCSQGYPACNAHAPYCIINCGLPDYAIFFHIFHKRPDFREKKLLNIKFVLIFSTTFVSDISHWKKKWARYDHKCILVVMQSPCCYCPIWMNLNFFDRFSKNTRIKFHEHPFSGNWVVLCRWTDMTKITAAFRKFAKAPKGRCNERRTCLKNVSVNPIPTFPHFCPLLVKMR